MSKYYMTYRAHGERALAAFTRRPFISATALLGLFCTILWYQKPFSTLRNQDRRSGFDGQWHSARDKNNLMLDDSQCTVAFPRLFEEVSRAVEGRKLSHITSEELDEIEPKNGYVRAMIYDQGLYVIQKQGAIYSRELSTLHAIYRAILTSPLPLPNIEFVFNTDDIVFEPQPLWAYARKAEHNHLWLMPDFGFFSWPETLAGSMREVQLKAVEEEDIRQHPWHNKIEKVLWRGATMGLALRDRLLSVTTGKEWADVVALDWHDKDSMQHDLKSMPEHCDYKYLVHTEGNSYSGRLKYLQACQSVVIAHKMDWIQHYFPLLEATRGPNQNYIEVDRDFDELESTVDRLRRNDKEARKIATNSVRTFRERYLTAAAEACYWRRLIRGWAEVSFEPEFYKLVNGTKQWRGLPFESFALERRLEWDPY
ncbi:hypothetical protein LTR64_006140 [Lithohypha guttulata]|uniref:uncharacterized protein n=1 Tax=Lithohypha guttulata TaxID=1690604 RepID=UPI002DDF1A4A|nr:hypothetical protein LTR51_002062 [Lithohypha guttulata]